MASLSAFVCLAKALAGTKEEEEEMVMIGPVDPPRNPSVCPKCDALALHREYCSRRVDSCAQYGCKLEGEHLHRRCSCGYRWGAPCVDSKEGA